MNGSSWRLLHDINSRLAGEVGAAGGALVRKEERMG